jgi:hypothetical protein
MNNAARPGRHAAWIDEALASYGQEEAEDEAGR